MNNDWFTRWIFDSYHPTVQGLALFRIFAALMFLFFLMPDATIYAELANFPDDFFSPPPGPMMLINSFPPVWFFYMIHAFLVISWLSVLFGYNTQKASLAAALFMLILLGFIFSIGKVNHQMLLVLLPAIMAFSNWGGTFSLDAQISGEKAEANGWPLTLLALFIGFMMFTAGFPKILGGWLSGDTLAARGHLFNQYFVRGRTELLSGFMVELNMPLVWNLLDWATVLFETGFLIAVFRAGWTRLFICFAVLFHFSTMLTLNIAFLVNFPAYAAFLPWDKIYNWFNAGISAAKETKPLLLLYGSAIVAVFTVIKIVDKTGHFMSPREPTFDDIAIISAALLIVSSFGIRKVVKLISSLKS